MFAPTDQFLAMIRLRTIMTKISKPKLAIYDFTDCEGCEVQLVSLLEDFLKLEKRVEIVNWRLGQEHNHTGPFDVCFIEGTPITLLEQKLLKELRAKSKILVGLGACATLGGVPAIITKQKRNEMYKKVYGAGYRPRGLDSLPLNHYVPVDYMIHGCPADRGDILRSLTDLLAGKMPAHLPYPVCLECKLAGPECRLLNEKPCLGSVSQAGCNAVCVKGGTGCYGCRGSVAGANWVSLHKTLQNFMTKDEIKKFASVFLSATKEYKNLK